MMRLFLKCLFILIVVCLLNLFVVYVTSPLARTSYFGASLDKQQNLDTHEAGSVILVGGSNVAFGYDSTAMQSLLNRPVINSGLHADLGLRYILNSVSPFIREGDLVLLSIEYEQYVTSPDMQYSDAMRRMLDIDFTHNVRYITTSGQWESVLDYHAEYMAQNLWGTLTANPCPGSTYCRASFDEIGDVRSDFIVSTDSTRATLQGILGSVNAQEYNRSLEPEAVDLLNDFAELVTARHATALIILPAIPDEIFDLAPQGVQNIAQQIHAEIAIPVLNEPVSYPLSYFYDTIYHLNNEGRTAHTADTMQLLTAALNP